MNNHLNIHRCEAYNIFQQIKHHYQPKFDIFEKIENDDILTQKVKDNLKLYSKNPIEEYYSTNFAYVLMIIWQIIENDLNSIILKKILNKSFENEVHPDYQIYELICTIKMCNTVCNDINECIRLLSCRLSNITFDIVKDELKNYDENLIKFFMKENNIINYPKAMADD